MAGAFLFMHLREFGKPIPFLLHFFHKTLEVLWNFECCRFLEKVKLWKNFIWKNEMVCDTIELKTMRFGGAL